MCACPVPADLFREDRSCGESPLPVEERREQSPRPAGQSYSSPESNGAQTSFSLGHWAMGGSPPRSPHSCRTTSADVISKNRREAEGITFNDAMDQRHRGIPSFEALDRRNAAGAPELIGQEYRGSGLDLAISGCPTGDGRRLRIGDRQPDHRNRAPNPPARMPPAGASTRRIGYPQGCRHPAAWRGRL